MPEISVLIPSYNRVHLLPRALDSIWRQEFDDLEVLIVDDGSTDGTIACLDELKSQRPELRYVIHDVNKGEAAARNTALREAKGTYVAYLDSDDVWLPGKLKAQIHHLTSVSPEAAGVVTACYMVDGETSTLLDDWHFHEPITAQRVLVKGCGLNLNSTMMMRRETALAAGPYDETLRLYVDIDWVLRFLAEGRIDVISEPFALYNKAPWRDGRLVEQAADVFRQKHAAAYSALSGADLRRAKATLAWNSAICYRNEGDKWNYLRQASKALALWPRVPVGNYLAVPDMFLGGRLLPVLRGAKSRLSRNGPEPTLPAKFDNHRGE